MANSAPSGPNDYNSKIIEEFRANGGRVGRQWVGTTLILVHHIGAKSGIERVSPLAYSLQGRPLRDLGRQWRIANPSKLVLHLTADPRIKVEVDTQTFTVLAEELHDTARAELWPKLATQYPQLGEIQAKTMRHIPLFMLTRQD